MKKDFWIPFEKDNCKRINEKWDDKGDGYSVSFKWWRIFSKKVEVGEIAIRGRYRGTPTPYGNGELILPINYNLTMYDHLDVFRNCGAENIDLVIGVFYEGQCNFTFPLKAMKLIFVNIHFLH